MLPLPFKIKLCVEFQIPRDDFRNTMKRTKGDCAHWRHRENKSNIITYSKWASNEGCEGDTCARIQGNGRISA